MADIFAPLRAEPLIDPLTGNITIRYAEYFQNLADNVNEVVISTEDAEGFFSEIQQIQSFSAVLNNNINEIDQLSTQLGTTNAKIAELQKQIDDLNELQD